MSHQPEDWIAKAEDDLSPTDRAALTSALESADCWIPHSDDGRS